MFLENVVDLRQGVDRLSEADRGVAFITELPSSQSCLVSLYRIDRGRSAAPRSAR